MWHALVRDTWAWCSSSTLIRRSISRTLPPVTYPMGARRADRSVRARARVPRRLRSGGCRRGLRDTFGTTAWLGRQRLRLSGGDHQADLTHSLRHNLITAGLDAGVPLRDVQDAASHADPRTTMRYDRARQSLDRHATYIVAALCRRRRPLTTHDDGPAGPVRTPNAKERGDTERPRALVSGRSRAGQQRRSRDPLGGATASSQ